MTFADVSPQQLPTVWNWIAENPELHMADEGPKNLKEFVTYILAENIKLIAVSKGKKLVGMIGFKECEDHNEIRGIHFIPEVRGQRVAHQAVAGLVVASEPKPVRLRFLADNPYMLGFLRKFYVHFMPTDLKAHRGDEEIPFLCVELRVNPRVTLA